MKLLDSILIGIPLAVVFRKPVLVLRPCRTSLLFASYSIFYDWLNLIRR